MKIIIIFTIIATSSLAKPNPGLATSFFSSRIVGGKDAILGQLPYQISYQRATSNAAPYVHQCGGSIISPTWTITAGHCILQLAQDGVFRVIAGIASLSKDQGQAIKVIKKVVHPKYTGGIRPYDIALLQLEKPFTFNANVQFLALPKLGTVVTGNTILSGWGSIRDTGPWIPDYPDVLQMVELPIVAIEECYDAYEVLLSSQGNLVDLVANVCTGPLEGGYGACSGDSGGPLVQNGTLVGVDSWGMLPCGMVGAPSVFTRVSVCLDFIGDYVDDLPESRLND